MTGTAGAKGAATFDVAAEAYDRHIGRYGAALGRQLIAAARVGPGMDALDVGCGPGPLTAQLVALLGAAHVSAVDPSPSFAAACRARHPGVTVRLAAAEALPFDDATFDAALAQLVVNFMTDPVKGVGEMARVTRPGGVVAAAVWDYAGGMTLLRTFWDTVTALDPDAADRDEALRMRFAAPDELAGLWATVGLRDVRTQAADVTASYTGFEDLWSPFAAGVGPAGAHAAALDADRRATLAEAFRARLGVADAPFELAARAWVVTGRVA